MAVFTRKDRLNRENIDIKEFLDKGIDDSYLTIFLQRIKHRCVVLGLVNQDDNVKQLLRCIDNTVETNNGMHYNNDMYKIAIQKMKQKEERRGK